MAEAGSLAGVHPSTVLEWFARGEGRDPMRPKTPIYAAFADEVGRARAADEARRIARLEQAGRGGAVVSRKTTTFPDGRVVVQEEYSPPDWRADAFHLERHYPDKWGRRDRMELKLSIEAAAERVATELGLTTKEVLEEAALLLREVDYHVVQ